MATPYESAKLNLKLFELRRDPLLREARNWFISEFHPESFADFAAAAAGKGNTYIRMVVGYWSMAASLVATGAIDAESFLAAHGEIVGVFSKVQPFLADLREALGEPDLLKDVEAVVMSAPNADDTLRRRREMLKQFAQARAKGGAAQPERAASNTH